MEILQLGLTALLSVLFGSIVIYIVGRLKLGMVVRDFRSAVISAVVITVLSLLVGWIISLLGVDLTSSFIGAAAALAVAVGVLMLSDRFVKGMRIDGVYGAIIAAIVIAFLLQVAAWLAGWLAGLIG